MTGRKIIPVLAGFAVLSLTTAPAWGGPLLSGYGGPGQGNQAVLGATLLQGPRDGGGGGGAGGGGAGPGGGSGGGSSVAGESPAQRLSTASRAGAPGASVPSGGSAGGAGGAGGPAGGHATPPPTSVHQGARAGGHPSGRGFSGYTLSERSAPAQPWLGISGRDLVYIVLVLGVLAFAGVLTGRLAAAGRTASPGRSRGAP